MSYHQKKIQSFLASRELLHDSHVRGSLFFFFFAFPLVESLFTKFIRIGFSEEYLEFCIQIVFKERRVLMKFYDSLMILQ